MNKFKRFKWIWAVVAGLAAASTHASIIQSMTIEEIGVVSGGLGSSMASGNGGEFALFGDPPSWRFASAGSRDGTIVMGRTQGTNAFSSGFILFGVLALPHTLNGAPTGSITGATLALDLSGWGARWSNLEFMLFPDPGTLRTSVLRLDADRYYYTADWSHVITAAETPPFAGVPVSWHLEGVATVPEPGTAWLVGAAMLGLLGARRRKPL